MKTKRVKSLNDLPTKLNAALKRAAAKYTATRISEPTKEDMLAGLIDECQRTMNRYSDAVEKVTQLAQRNVRTLHDVVVVEVIARLAGAGAAPEEMAEDVKCAFRYADAVIAEKTRRGTAQPSIAEIFHPGSLGERL